MKRANGTGTIYKRRDTTHRRNPYSVYLDGGKDDNGKRIRNFLGSFPTFREAQDALEKYRQGVTIKPSNETPLKEVWELFKQDRESVTGKPILPGYASCWKNFIAPRLANVPVSNIKTMHMQACINACKSKGEQRAMRSVFSGLFTYAISNDLATKDYAAALTVPSLEKSTMHKPFTTEEMRWLWSRTNVEVCKIILIQTYTGMRKAELERMLLSNVNLKESYMIGGLKTAAGKGRVIPIADCIMPFVRHFYAISRFAGFQYLIMPDKEKGIYSCNKILDMEEVYRHRFSEHRTHDARHTFVTLCSNYGQPESTVKKIIGHKDSNITDSIYTHKTAKQLLDLVNALPYGTQMYMSPDEKDGSHVVAT